MTFWWTYLKGNGTDWAQVSHFKRNVMVFILFHAKNDVKLKLTLLEICEKAFKKDHKLYLRSNLWFTIPTVTLIADLYQACLFSKGKEVPSRPFYAIRRKKVETNACSSLQVHIHFTKSLILNFSRPFHLLTVTYSNAQPKTQENLSSKKWSHSLEDLIEPALGHNNPIAYKLYIHVGTAVPRNKIFTTRI